MARLISDPVRSGSNLAVPRLLVEVDVVSLQRLALFSSGVLVALGLGFLVPRREPVALSDPRDLAMPLLM